MPVRLGGATVPIEKIDVSAYTIPTDRPEADGTITWEATTIVIVETEAGGQRGLGYTYADAATAALAQHMLARVVRGLDALSVEAAWRAMMQAIRNQGRPGIVAMAVAAVDNALWDLKARLLGVPLAVLLGQVRAGVPVYGSGGFTTYSDDELQQQLAGWAEAGIPRVKMKIGSDPGQDLCRVRLARQAIGARTQLFVDANGAYSRKQALDFAERFVALDVAWFEEPVPSADLEGLRLLRDRAPASMDIAAGEYNYTLEDFRRILDAGAVDVLQADATRCAGITGFMRAAALCDAYGLPLSAHCAPALHVPPCCALAPVRHLEYFHDHVRIEQMLFDGVLSPVEGVLYPDRSRPGLGLDFKRQDAEQWRVRF